MRHLQELGIQAVGLDTVQDDQGRRLVVNSRAVAWNGLEVAFETLERTWPFLTSRDRRPVRVTIMGAGEIGKHAVEAATKYGNAERSELFMRYGLPGVEVTTIGRNLTYRPEYLLDRLRVTDILVDATQRHDPAIPLIRNESVGLLPPHAVICDLVVDPYLLNADPPTVRGIEGIPQGNLDRYVFDVNDPAWDELPPGIPTDQRRPVVSCYSWPGVHPKRCMELYGKQLVPLLEALVEQGRALPRTPRRLVSRAGPDPGKSAGLVPPRAGQAARRRLVRPGDGDDPGPRCDPPWMVARPEPSRGSRASRTGSSSRRASSCSSSGRRRPGRRRWPGSRSP